MKTELFAIFGAVLISVMCCSCFKKETDKISEINMSVNYETGFMYDLFDTYKEHPIECMLVMEEGDNGGWRTLPFGEIEGFTYERGHAYELRVRLTILANPPQDASNRRYSLIRILEDRLICEPEHKEDKVITDESDIEYYDAMCPIEKYAIEPVIMIDGSGRFYHFDGAQMPSYDNAFIYAENILDKADPDWIVLNKIPYMWCYSFILSPLSNGVRVVRNSINYIMLKDAVSEKEMEYIINDLQSGYELRYVLYVGNIYKYAIQRLEFTVRKI